MNNAKICYRIYIEDKEKQTELLNIVECFLDNYTVYSGCLGGFNGMRELSTIIEYIGLDAIGSRLQIQELAKQLKSFYNQAGVTITTSPCLHEDI